MPGYTNPALYENSYTHQRKYLKLCTKFRTGNSTEYRHICAKFRTSKADCTLLHTRDHLWLKFRAVSAAKHIETFRKHLLQLWDFRSRDCSYSSMRFILARKLNHAQRSALRDQQHKKIDHESVLKETCSLVNKPPVFRISPDFLRETSLFCSSAIECSCYIVSTSLHFICGGLWKSKHHLWTISIREFDHRGTNVRGGYLK